jgi:DNA-binding transcriptional LysR family regulator
MQSIEIKKVFAFCAVCETLSFTEAAKSLGLTQSTISHHISSFEKEVGIDLFKRTSRSVELTPEGQKVYHYAKKIFEAFKDFEGFLAVKDTENTAQLPSLRA